jgi:hypothetical protein
MLLDFILLLIQLFYASLQPLSLDEKRALYDRYGYEGVKAGGDPNPQPDLSGFFPQGGHGLSTHTQPHGFGFGFDSPFFSPFGNPASAGFNGGFSSTTPHSPLSSQQPYSIGNVYGSNENILHDILTRGELRAQAYCLFTSLCSRIFLPVWPRCHICGA